MERKIKKTTIVKISVLCLIVFALAVYPKIKHSSYINKAMNAISNGDYKEAYSLFEEAGEIGKYKKDEVYEFYINLVNAFCEIEDFLNASSVAVFMPSKAQELIDEKTIEETEQYITYREAVCQENAGEYCDAYYSFKRCEGYQDSDTQAQNIFDNHKDVFYELAKENYEKGTTYDFLFAQKQFEMLDDYKDSKEYLDKIMVIPDFEGVYAGSHYTQGDRYFEVDGLRGYMCDSDGQIIISQKLVVGKYNNQYCMVTVLEEQGYNNNETFAFIYNENGEPQRCKVRVDDNNEIISVIEMHQKKTDSTQFYEEFNRKPPAIGMTAEEVRKSTWGEPEKINKTTYSWGVEEQWCYSGYRYIYLENDTVTAIQE